MQSGTLVPPGTGDFGHAGEAMPHRQWSGRLDWAASALAGSALVAVAGGCFHPSYDHPACGPGGACPDGLRCNDQNICESDPIIPDGGVADRYDVGLTALGAGQRVDMTLDATRVSLTPNAYTYGGLVAHGLGGTKLWTHGDTSWSKLDPATATGAGLWCGEHILAGARLDHLGVVNDTTMTLWLEGEVWLDGAPDETFFVLGDDVAFVELALPRTTAYQRIAENAAGAVMTSGPGWYPVRVGFSNGDAGFDFQFTHASGGGGQVLWARDRLRARTSELTGMLRTVYGMQILGGGLGLGNGQVAPPVAHFEQKDLLQTDLQQPQQPPPQGTQPNGEDWSARYVGQIYIVMPGSYTLQIDSDDGNRGRLGEGRGEQHWGRDDGVGGNDALTRISADLSAGWNDLVVDFNQGRGGSNLRVRIQGPDFPSLSEIPCDRLRPVEFADDRLAIGVNDSTQTVPQDGGPGQEAVTTLPVVGYTVATGAMEVVDAIELTYHLNSPHWDQLKVDLETPGSPGTRVTIRDRQGVGGGDGDRTVQQTIPVNATGALAMLRNGLANGVWELHVYDVVNNGGSSSLLGARLTLHTRGGPDKIARTASWTSQVIDMGTPVFAIDGVTWKERTPPGSSVQVRVRTCQDSKCAGVDWPDAVTKATPFNVPRGRYLQLRIDMTSDGTHEPELSGLAVASRRDPG